MIPAGSSIRVENHSGRVPIEGLMGEGVHLNEIEWHGHVLVNGLIFHNTG